MNPLTNGPVVDQHRETSLDGFFAAGNVVHVHDLVDFVSEEAEIAGKYAALKAQEKMATENRTVTVKAIDGVRTCVPQKLTMLQKFLLTRRLSCSSVLLHRTAKLSWRLRAVITFC